MVTKAKCPHCGSDQLDTVSINMDAVKCRKCARWVTGLELLQQHRENSKPNPPMDHDHWMKETWRMIELCAANKADMRVVLTPAGCAELVKIKNNADRYQWIRTKRRIQQELGENTSWGVDILIDEELKHEEL